MTRRGKLLRREQVLGEILADAADRRSAGESPAANEYAARHPELREDIVEHLGLMDLLAAARQAKESDAGATGQAFSDFAAAVAELPVVGQKVIYLRHVERLSWPEIAQRLEQPEADLRRKHAADLRRLIERCRGWLEGSMKD